MPIVGTLALLFVTALIDVVLGSTGLVVGAMVVGTALWAGVDAARLEMKKRKYSGGVATTFAVALIWILAFPVYLFNRRKVKAAIVNEQAVAAVNATSKRCSACGERIKREAAVCRFCHSTLTDLRNPSTNVQVPARASLSVQQPLPDNQSQIQSSKESRYCDQCGAAFQNVGARFCPHCGAAQSLRSVSSGVLSNPIAELSKEEVTGGASPAGRDSAVASRTSSQSGSETDEPAEDSVVGSQSVGTSKSRRILALAVVGIAAVAAAGLVWFNWQPSTVPPAAKTVAMEPVPTPSGASEPPAPIVVPPTPAPATTDGSLAEQFNLGLKYYSADGVERDYKKAEELFRLAAEDGYSRASYALAAMYAKGEGLAVDYVEAYKWVTIASARADSEMPTMPDDERSQMSQDRDSLEKAMTPEQIAEAKQKAQDWIDAFQRKREAR